MHLGRFAFGLPRAASLCPRLTCCGPFGARKRMKFLPGDIPAGQHSFQAMGRERHEFAAGCLCPSNPTRLLTSKGLLIRERESSSKSSRTDEGNPGASCSTQKAKSAVTMRASSQSVADIADKRRHLPHIEIAPRANWRITPISRK